jgi:hypothetical protein
MSQENKSSIKKWYIPVFLFGLAIGYIGLNNGCNVDNVKTDTTKHPTVNIDTTLTDNPVPDTETKEDEGLKSVTLPGGKEIAFAEGSTTEKIVTFMNADEMDMKTGFDLDGSDRQISNIAALLEVYSDFGIQLEGDSKATDSIKSSLAALGMDAKRMSNKATKGNKNVKLYFIE